MRKPTNELNIYVRRAYFNDCTFSRLHTDKGLQLFCLELPWRGNAPNISCVPEGIYNAFIRTSPKNGIVIELKDVPDRSFIQFHVGNYTRNIEGCILPGMTISHIDSDGVPDVGSSGIAMQELLKQADKVDNIVVHILGAEKPVGVYNV